MNSVLIGCPITLCQTDTLLTIEQTLNLHHSWWVVIDLLSWRPPRAKVHFQPQMKCIYLCHCYRCWKNGLLYHTRKYLTPPATPYLCKVQIEPRIVYCYHISLSSQKRLCLVVGDELFITLYPYPTGEMSIFH